MLISQAHAQTEPTPPATTAETAVPSANGAPATPVDTQGILLQNVAMIVLLVIMFYFLLIRPQQKRFKEHKEMVDSLKVGDTVHVNGLVGTVAALTNDKEISVDLGGTKVTALRAFVTTPQPEKPATDKTKK
jgi:preprotein translocase subunit YajC